MFKRINVNFNERNPLGERMYRNDECELWRFDAKKNKEMVRKAIDFMFKIGRNDDIPCDSVLFVFDGYWLYCEAENSDVWNGNKILTVTKYYEIQGSWRTNCDAPYRIDAGTLRRQMYKACDDRQVEEELRAEEVAA